MLNEFLFPKIEEDDIDDIWFHQDWATYHTTNVTIDLLRTVFENRITSRNSDVNWPPRSCDLTPLDYFLWGAVKDKFYAKHLETDFWHDNYLKQAAFFLMLTLLLKLFKMRKTFKEYQLFIIVELYYLDATLTLYFDNQKCQKKYSHFFSVIDN